MHLQQATAQQVCLHTHKTAKQHSKTTAKSEKC